MIRIIGPVYVTLLLILTSATVRAQGFSLPERPYEPLLWSDRDDVPLPVAWYTTMYDSTSLALGSDGYNSLQILTDKRDEQVLIGDNVINIIMRDGIGKTAGAYVESLNAYSGDLQWRRNIVSSDQESEMTARFARVVDDKLQIMAVQRVGPPGPLEWFPLAISADSCKLVVWDMDLESGAIIDTQYVADEEAFTVETRFSQVANVTSHYVWNQDSVLYYEYSRERPQEVLRASLSLDGVEGSIATLPHGSRAGSFDLYPWQDDQLLTFDHEADGIYLMEVDQDLSLAGRRVIVPVYDPASFVYVYDLPGGSIAILDQYFDDIQWHVYNADLDLVTTVENRLGTFSNLFFYQNDLYLLSGKPVVGQGGLDLYEVKSDSLSLLYEWTIEDGRSFVPRVVSIVDDLLIVLGNEGAEELSDPGRSDSAAKAASTIAIDLSQLSLLTSTDEVAPLAAVMSVYPNPTSGGMVTVTLEEAAPISLYDLSGAMVTRSSRAQVTHQLSTVGLPAGTYIVQSDDGVTSKLIVQ